MTRGGRCAAVVAALVALGMAPVRAAVAPPATDAATALAAVRQQCIAAAQREQQQEAAVSAAQHQLDLLAADEAGRQRDLDDSRPQQAHLLGALLVLSRNLDNPQIAADRPPLDRHRGELLIRATAAELRAEAQALITEIRETRRLRGEIAARRSALPAAQAALTQDRAQLAQLVAQRLALLRPLMQGGAAEAASLNRLAAEATDVGELIKSADATAAAAERRAHANAARSSPDQTRPSTLRAFDPPQSALLLPVSGTISQHFGDPEADGRLSRGLDVAAMPGAVVIAPFDGEVVYAGAFGDLGLLLIIRHGALYHSLLAGLGRVDVIADQWVLAGEPVGQMPQAAALVATAGSPPGGSTEQEQRAGGLLHFELRRGGSGGGDQPVDPQPWLAAAAGETARAVQKNRE